MANVETVESLDTKYLIVGTSRRKNQGKGKGTGEAEIQGDRNQ